MHTLLPVQASAHAAQLDLITLLVHVLMGALLLGWGSVFVYSLVRFRAGRHPRADYHGARSRLSTYSEAALVIAKLILLVGFSLPAWAMLTRDLPPAHEAVVLRVVAEQFAWNVHYPGADGRFGRTEVARVAAENPLGLDPHSADGQDDVVALNEIVVPVNRPVIVQLSAKDVIHSFGVPAMRVKQDANPGMITSVWFTPTRTGEFDVACSQLCGVLHYRMRAVLRVVTQDEFDRWLADAAQPAAAR